MATEGLKYDQGKPDYSLLPPDSLEEVVRVYDFGCKKYERDNWRRGIKYSRIFGAIMRHLWAWWKCEDRDEESGLRHLAQAAWGCFTLLEYTRNAKYQLFDDRLVDTGAPVNPEDSAPVSIPSCWYPDVKNVPYQLTVSKSDGVWYYMKDGIMTIFDPEIKLPHEETT